MLTPDSSTQFKKDLQKAQKRGKDIPKLKEIMCLLVNEISLPPKNRDHSLGGNYAGFRECHIEPDWLLIYKTGKHYIVFDRLGTHSDLF